MHNSTSIRIAYVTTQNIEEAKNIGGFLVKNRLAACVNILPQMESIYFWEGKLENDTETVMLVKTTISQMDAVTSSIREKHSYECPCILWMSLEGGNEEYIQWLNKQVER